MLIRSYGAKEVSLTAEQPPLNTGDLTFTSANIRNLQHHHAIHTIVDLRQLDLKNPPP